jgi:PhzF family phenazine biosynthesis protein
MTIEIVHVDAFTDTPFRGNPAAVCLLPQAAEAGWMQDVAREMNLSETAFLWPAEDGFQLHWFTPAVEVDLCGHATLASAHVLWSMGRVDGAISIRFHTRSGLLEARLLGSWIELDFPAEPATETTSIEGLLEALGVEASWVGRNRFDFLVEVDSEETVRRLQPDLRRIEEVVPRGVMVTSPAASPGYDFVSRFFAPRVGVPEDPVTGSAHCCLGPFWQHRLGKEELLAYQASRRGGEVRVRVAGERVFLSGQAVTVLRGELVV